MNDLKTLRDVLVENLERNMMPFPVDKGICTGWTRDLPRSGETIIYTSCMYQLAPLFPIFNRFLPYLSALKSLTPLASRLKPSEAQLNRAYNVLRKISNALTAKGIKLAYLYDDEPYSGALLLELGFLDEFQEYAKKVYGRFKERGVKRIITVDPHTHNALTRYSEFFSFDVEVVNYIELVEAKEGDGNVYTIHDSCLYSRFLNLRDKFREKIKVKLVEDEMVTGKDTSFCCGGPLAPVDFKASEEVAKARAKSLSKLSKNLLVQCPICYVTLSPHFEGEVKDVAEVIL
ncbi:MAG: (Fe-S)-binding protein [Candidatus Aramenus sp.]|nr:(Fe-S)-binding protein [Candidatus Aramenus sp.]